MKKFLLVAGVFLLSMGVKAQVGINAGENPKATLEVGYDTEWAKTNRAQGVIFPKMQEAQRDLMQNVPEGMMIYNLTQKCLDLYDGATWTCVAFNVSTRKYSATKTATYRETFTRSDCAPGTPAGTYEVSKTATATATSTQSQADADQKAEAEALEQAKQWVKANGQSEADTKGTCQVYTFTKYATYSETFTRDNCPSNTTPGTYEVSRTEKATATSEVSKIDAFRKAKAAALEKATNWVKTNGQQEANNNAQCTPITYTSTQTRSYSKDFTKNDCEAGYDGSVVTYTQSATATATSTQSQADADQKAGNKASKEAQRLVENGGQSYANANGTCKESDYYSKTKVCYHDYYNGKYTYVGEVLKPGIFKLDPNDDTYAVSVNDPNDRIKCDFATKESYLRNDATNSVMRCDSSLAYPDVSWLGLHIGYTMCPKDFKE